MPGYGTIVGTEETSEVKERPFSAFRSVFYAEQPTAENRFLVSLVEFCTDLKVTALTVIYIYIKLQSLQYRKPPIL